MDTIGLGPQIKLQSLPTSSVPSAPAGGSTAGAAPIVPLPGQQLAQVDFNAQTAEQTRAEAVLKAAEQLANVFVIGDSTFSLFKDSTGQYITRFTSLRDGRVTYIPEPTLFKLSSGGAKPLLKIEA